MAEGPAAIALSRGGAPKTYPHTDPNEDAAAFALGEAGAWVAVADAHNGAAASEAALEHLRATRGATWTGAELPPAEAWREAALEALWETHQAVLRGAGRRHQPGSRTTLALALHHRGAARILFASAGDSHVFRIGEDATADLAAPGHPCSPRYFLGSEPLRREELEEQAVVGDVSAAGLRAVVLATDGVSERGIGLAHPDREAQQAAARAAADASQPPALALARDLAERANAAQRERASGDNVAVATLWLEAP